MNNFYKEIYSKQVNNTIRYNRNERWLTFYINGVAVTRKVFKNKIGEYYIRIYNSYYKINTYVFNEILSLARNPIIDF